MNYIRLTSLFSAGLILFSACEDETPNYYHEKPFDLADFTGLHFGANFQVEVSEREEFKVIAKGEDTDLNDLEMNVQNGVLVGQYKGNRHSHKQTIIQIQMPEIHYLHLEGVAMAKVPAFEIVTEEIQLRLEGNSRLELGESSTYLETEISGTSELSLSAEFTEIQADISGKSVLHAFSAAAETWHILLNGESQANVKVTDSLTGSVAGKSTLRYKGEPTLVSVEVETLSKLIHEE